MEVLRPLGTACRDARKDAALLLADISIAAGMSVAQLSMFERGLATPVRLEAVVECYEAECRLGDGELWRRAIGMPGSTTA